MRKFIFLLSLILLSSIVNIQAEIIHETFDLSMEEKDKILACWELVQNKLNKNEV